MQDFQGQRTIAHLLMLLTSLGLAKSLEQYTQQGKTSTFWFFHHMATLYVNKGHRKR